MIAAETVRNEPTAPPAQERFKRLTGRAVEKLKNGHNASALTVPIAIVLGLVAHAFIVGRQTGSESAVLKQTADAVAQLSTAVGTIQSDKELVRLQTRFEELVKQIDRDQQQREREMRLLRDYVEGRVGHLPYRAPRGGSTLDNVLGDE